MDLFEFGLCGMDNSAVKRQELLRFLSLPEYLSTNAMISALNCLYTYDEFNLILNKFINNTEVNYES